MSQVHSFSVSDHWDGPFDETRFEVWAKTLRSCLQADTVDLGIIFATPGYEKNWEEILEILQIHCRVSTLIGCSGNALVSQGFEFEEGMGVSVSLLSLPGAKLTSFEFSVQELEYLNAESGSEFEQRLTVSPNGFLIFADPFSMNPEKMLAFFNREFPEISVHGGLACGTHEQRESVLFLNNRVVLEGAVGLAVGGDVVIESVISQGCQPVGESYIITSAAANVLNGIGNRSAYDVLSDVFSGLPDAMKLKSKGNLHVGFVIDEYQEDYQCGDFLVRNLIGADPKSGALLVGALPRVGQTLQFQMRDRHAAMEDLNKKLNEIQPALQEREIFGAILSTCTGRGKRFFKVPDFDASSIQECIGPVGMVGFFGNGEFGPVGGVNFVHGYTAALAIFASKR
tara:strand:+ start:7469 stop:8662 length:1194 start_codon:yes stop_codon:yes gene_type:complete